MQTGHRLVLLPGGDALFAALVQAMDTARTSVHLETYIFEFEGAPLRVAEALERAAQRGLSVRLVVDGIGTGPLPVEWRDRFDRAGVQWRVFAPLGRFGLLIPSRWRRLHRKLCVVDGVLGFCGGINVIDDHLDPAMGPLTHPRFDFAVRCTGPLVLPMAFTVLQLWWRMDALKKARQSEFRRAWADVLASAHPPPAQPGVTAQLVLRDNLWHRNDIERAYLAAIADARHEVVLANAYFVPGGRLRRALLQAARRGVRVRVLLQGKYEGFMQYHAARPVYKQLLDGGVELREYTLSALHAKVAVVDHRWATVGSSNLDPLSLLLAREANVVSTDVAFATDLHRHLMHAWAHAAEPLDHTALRLRPWRQRVWDRVAFGLMRAVLFISGHRY
ncbi:MAG: cardiolipin synthase ClsB [Burkholderiaceae bacterium]